jgi:hypothetical protein
MDVRLRTLRILWAAITASSVMLLGVLWMVRRSQPPPGQPEPILLPVLGFVALSVAVVSVVMPRTMLRQALGRLDLRLDSEPDPHAEPSLFRDSAPMRKVFAEPERARERAVMPFQTTLILGLALSEAVAIFGFVLGMLGFDLAYVLPFFVVSWILCAVRRPSLEQIERALEQAKQAVFAR